MIKKIIVSVSLLFSIVSLAQSGTASPYSYYGIGDVRFKGLAENKSMAGISSIPDSLHINIQNPAMYSNLRFTSYAVGATYSSVKLQTSEESEKAKRTTIDYLVVGIPYKKLGFGFGILPYSYVGYDIRGVSANSDGSKSVVDRYQGSGGINKAFLGLSYQIAKGLSFGADVQYNFGRITTTDAGFQSDINGYQTQYGTLETNVSDASGLSVNTGLSFKTKINKSMIAFTSATYAPHTNLSYNNSRVLGLVQPGTTSDFITVGTLTSIAVENTTVKLPSKLVFGAGIGVPNKWIVSSEITYQDFSGFGNRYADPSQGTYENATKIAVGGYYIPNYKSFGKYYKKIVYRGGYRYENTGLLINGTAINDSALTMGLGMPLKGTFSNVNLGFEYGSRGTKSYGLVKENYFNFSIGLSFNDQWFQKKKIY